MSRMRRSSMGSTTRPRLSTGRTIPVDFIVLSFSVFQVDTKSSEKRVFFHRFCVLAPIISAFTNFVNPWQIKETQNSQNGHFQALGRSNFCMLHKKGGKSRCSLKPQKTDFLYTFARVCRAIAPRVRHPRHAVQVAPVGQQAGIFC